MNKRKLHHFWTKIRAISYWYFLILTIAALVVFILSYRQNNLRMIELRDAVFAADEAGEDVESALRDLREHVHSHMNTNLTGPAGISPPIQLTHRYERLTQAESQRVAEHNRQVRQDAESICLDRVPAGPPGTLARRAECVQDYISQNSIEEQPIPKELYQFDFVSPRWSPDLAGWSLVAAICFGVLFALRFITERWLQHQFKTHE